MTWPPTPIVTERLVLRQSEARDRAAYVELFASPEVGTYIGGSQPRADVERAVSELPGRRFGSFVAELDGAMIGMITFDGGDAGETEIGYLFLPSAWGQGYATEACVGALAWFASTRPGESVALRTQTANTASLRLAAKLGFTEVKRYVEYGAEQWLGVWSPDR
ncbi:GNAT family N-acetyltransferase [Amycolatopsis sp. NPDC026612]|uniref:GNAT family N-acetyltransferase n=1 Tax=Amycolatopsis sp. NPDC026612 TaxID=3155466 RepID=UPI0033CEB180